jgi:transcriptional regulator with XRE-family HTH domain
LVSVDTQRLAALLIAKRAGRGLRSVATEIGGVSASRLSRIEGGKVPDLDTFIRLCEWLGVSPSEFTTGDANGDAGTIDNADVIVAHLRADRTLDRETARALEQMIRVAYAAAKSGRLPTEDED